MFLNQSLMVGGLPFELKQPQYNAATEQAMVEARAISSGAIPVEICTSAKEMLEALE